MGTKIIQFENTLGADSSYLASFDPYLQRAMGLSYDFVRRRLYIQCLMNERVFTSISHILGSTISTRLLQENKLLLEEKIIVPYSREYHSVTGIVRDRFSRYDGDRELYERWGIPISKSAYQAQIFGLTTATSKKDIRQVAEEKIEFLNSALKSVVSHSPLRGMQTFKNELLRDLRDSLASCELKSLDGVISGLVDFIDENVSDRLNRDLYFSILENHNVPRHVRERLLGILNFNYHIG